MRIENIVPQLRTTNLDRAIDFYTNTVGLALSFRYQDFYAGVGSGDRTIHLHIGVEDVQDAFQQIESAGAKIVEGISDRPWGTTEFVIEDPDGHTIYFGSSGAAEDR